MAVAQRRRTGKGHSAPVKGTGASDSPARTRTKHWARELAIAAAIFFVIKIFLVEAFRIPSGSMEPTLLIGDFLFVNKLVYGPHIPFTDVSLPGYSVPKRGEVAIYKSPDARDGHPTVVKRLVGIPGDTLYMRDGLLHANGIPQPLGYGHDNAITYPDETHPDFDWLKRAALAGSRFGAAPTPPSHDNWGPIVVPPGRFFSLGDSRYNSKDARYYGFVPRENIRGRPLFIYLSVDFDAWDVRWRRIGERIR